MRTLILIAIVALATASYFKPEVEEQVMTLENQIFEENHEVDPLTLYYSESSASSSSSSSGSSSSSSSSSSYSGPSEEEEGEHSWRPNFRGGHKGRRFGGRGHGPRGRPEHGFGGPRGPHGERPMPMGPDGEHPRPPHPPRPEPLDEFDREALDTLRQIGHGLLREWKLAEGAAVKNEIRSQLIEKLTTLIPIAEDPVVPEQVPISGPIPGPVPVEVNAVDLPITAEARLTEENGGN